jgi:hypothetical protein
MIPTRITFPTRIHPLLKRFGTTTGTCSTLQDGNPGRMRRCELQLTGLVRVEALHLLARDQGQAAQVPLGNL